MTQEEAIRWVAGLFSEPPERLLPHTARPEIAEWDSTGTLILVGSLDSDFGILLSDEEIPELRSVGDILEVLRRNGKLD